MRLPRGFGRYGNDRHPAQDQIVSDPRGRSSGANTRTVPAVVNGPSAQSVAQARGLGLAVNTASPMSSGFRVWRGDPGFGVNRDTARFSATAKETPVSGLPKAAVRPINNPTATRLGAQAGPSSQPAYPSTGGLADFGGPALALMSLPQITNGWSM